MTKKQNHVGGTNHVLHNPIDTLRIMAASSFFGEPAYYVDPGLKSRGGKINSKIGDTEAKAILALLGGLIDFKSPSTNTAEQLEQAIDAALDADLEATLKLAAELRNDDNIRTTPQVILVRAANHKKAKGSGLIRTYAKDIIKRGDEPAVQLAYQTYRFGKTIPNALKKAWADFLNKQTEFNLAKYRMENRRVKTIDVVRVSHAHSEAISKLVYNNLKLEENTWESLISSKGSNKATWEQAVDMMGHMALLRNLRNLHQNGVDIAKYGDKLLDGVKYGKQLPFRYYSAYNELQKAGAPKPMLKLVEDCMKSATEQMPKFAGKVAALCDNSGSAHGTFTSAYGSTVVADIANLTAVVTGMITEGEATVYPFGDKLLELKVDKTKGILEQADAVKKLAHNVGGGTETGVWLFWKQAIDKKEHFDHVFIYSDMQAGHGELYVNNAGSLPAQFKWGRSSTHVNVAALVAEYRKQVNPNVHVYLVQVAGYGDTIMPEYFDKTYILGGWSDGIFKFAHKMQQLNP